MPSRKRGPRPTKNRRVAGKPSEYRMTRFGSKGKNVLASSRQMDAVRRGDRPRLQEDETIRTSEFKAGVRKTAAQRGRDVGRVPPAKVSVTNPAGKTLSVSSKSALTRSGGFNKPPKAAVRRTAPPQAVRSVTSSSAAKAAPRAAGVRRKAS